MITNKKISKNLYRQFGRFFDKLKYKINDDVGISIIQVGNYEGIFISKQIYKSKRSLILEKELEKNIDSNYKNSRKLMVDFFDILKKIR